MSSSSVGKKSRFPEKIINIKSEMSSQRTGADHGNTTLNNTIDFFNEFQMGSSIQKTKRDIDEQQPHHLHFHHFFGN